MHTFRMFYVYILSLENGQFYIGFTRDLKRRLGKHSHGEVRTTAKMPPRELVFYAAFTSETKAFEFERYLKTSSGFAFRNKRLI